MPDWESLLEPIKIGSLSAKNRVEAAPTLPCLANTDGSVSTELVDYYAAKARGGAGIVTVGESAVDADYAITHGGQLIIDHERKIPGLSRLAETIKRYGALASLELCHGGRQTMPNLIGDRPPIGPSPGSSKLHELLLGRKIETQEMTSEMIGQVIQNFASAAFRLKQAGFDMCLVHGGHGWLLGQFLSPLTNLRTDEYGGSLENRSRFSRQVLEAIREKCGPEFGIELRFSGEELVPGGLQADEAMQFARLVEDCVDCFQVSCGMMGEPGTIPYVHPAFFLPRGRNVHLAARLKQSVSKPVTALGAIMDFDQAEAIVAGGEADMVAMARPLMADPALPSKSIHGRKDQVIPCIRCNECLARVAHFIPVRCAVNPLTGMETEYRLVPPATRKKKVVVVGGGPGGMEAALIAASRGHSVVLFERDEKLGGNLWVASQPPFKDDMKLFLSYLERQMDASSVDVRLGAEADASLVSGEVPDELVLAVGAEPLCPGIPGLDAAGVLWAGDVFAGAVIAGKTVVVAGGGGVGCETALYLSHQGKKVVVVEMLDEPALDYNFANRSLLLELLASHNVDIRTGCKLEAVKAGRVVVSGPGGKESEIVTDAVVHSLGMAPRTAIVDQLKGLALDVHVIGDCRSPRLIIDAVHEGFHAAIEM